MQVQPYLFFGAKVEMMMRNKESPESPPPGMKAPPEKIMHAAFRVGDTQVLASDGMCGGASKFQGFSLTLSARDDAEAKRFFGALSDGAQVQMQRA